MFEGLRSRIEQFLAQHTAPGDPRASAAQLHQAVVEAKVAVSQMKDGLVATERELVIERKQLEDAERRGKLAAGIPIRKPSPSRSGTRPGTGNGCRCWSERSWSSATS